ncbi:MAG: hypothetical protein ACI4KA_09800 [Oscillospiraceae bacterium]
MRLYGKKAIKDRLDFIASRRHMPHAVLLHGERGSGRKVMAAYIAKLFLCGAPPCESCNVCAKIDACAHPDVIYVKRECGGKYNLDETGKNGLTSMRRVMESVVVKPNDGDIKVYVFEDADEMSVQIQNTLLKTIEEPAPFLRFVFTCENTDSIIETIRSRVTSFEVPCPTENDCVQCLCDSGTDPELARRLAGALSGNIGKCFDILSGGGDTPYMETAKRAAAAIAQKNRYALAAALSEQSGRTEFAAVLDYLICILRDALAARCGGELSSCGKDEARQAAQVWDEERLLAMLEELFSAAADCGLNLNLSLTASYLTTKLI